MAGMAPEPSDMQEWPDWKLFDMIDKRFMSKDCRRLISELQRRYEPHADLEKPPDAMAWCLDCDWEKTEEPGWIHPDPMERVRKAAAGHIGNTDCSGYDYGRVPAE